MSTYPTYLTRSGWNALLPPRLAKNDAPSQRHFASIVIGAGYTGLAVARRLAELAPSEPVLVLEASQIGEGASGRNSGFLLINPGEPSAKASRFSNEEAARQMRLVEAGFEQLRREIRDAGIACDWNEAPHAVTAAATRRVEVGARATYARYRDWGLDPRAYESADLAALTGSHYYRFGLTSLTRALMQPAALQRGLADTLPASVTLLEETPVLKLGATAPHRVETSRGTFQAERLFVTNNLHVRSFGYGRSSLTGIVTYGAFTPELEDEDLDRLGAPEDWGILPAHRMGTTLRKVGRRLLIRSGDSYEREMTTARAKEMLHALYRNRFPHLRNEALEHIWGGYTAVTHNEAYLFGEMDPGVFVSAGCGGAGVVRGTIQGRLLADLAHGQGSDLLQDRLAAAKPRWLPPEPFRGLGAIAQIRYEQWFAGAER